MSFDAVATVSANIEVHGEHGSLVVPDPNRFDGDVRLRTLAAADWQTLPPSAGYSNASRGVGIEDLANTPEGHEPRAGGKLAFHVLEVMESLLVSAHAGRAIAIESRCERPAAVVLQALGLPQVDATG
jgi:predicted dehydrogenase